MDFDIREICDYYDSELRDYDYDELIRLGIRHDDADFMVSIGVPEEYERLSLPQHLVLLSATISLNLQMS